MSLWITPQVTFIDHSTLSLPGTIMELKTFTHREIIREVRNVVSRHTSVSKRVLRRLRITNYIPRISFKVQEKVAQTMYVVFNSANVVTLLL